MKMTDVHCHILPGVDDGAKDAMETRSMLEMAWNEGIRTIFATSHYDSEMGTGIWKRRKEALEQTRRMAAEISPELKIASGAEIFFSEKAVEELEKGRIWTMNQSRYVLVEFFPGEEFFYIQRGLQTLQYKGFWPILAHVERYLQTNASSVIGRNGRRVKKHLRCLLKERLIHFVGTDAHGSRHRRPLMAECAAYIEKKTDREYCRKICRENAGKIIRREYIHV